MLKNTVQNFLFQERKQTVLFVQHIRQKTNRWIQLALIQYDNWFPKFAKEGLNAPQLLEDERFATYAAMLQNIPALVEALEPYFAKKILDEWDEILTKLDLPFERVQTMAELAEDPQMWANDSIFKKETPDGRTSTTSEHLLSSQLILCLRKKKAVEDHLSLVKILQKSLKSSDTMTLQSQITLQKALLLKRSNLTL